MHRVITAALAIGSLMPPITAAAQTVTLVSQSGTIAATGVDATIGLRLSGNTTLTVSCTQPVDCTQVRARIMEGQSEILSLTATQAATAGAVSFPIEIADVTGGQAKTLVLAVDGADVQTYPLSPSPQQQTPTLSQTGPRVDLRLSDLLIHSCVTTSVNAAKTDGRATIVVGPIGQVYDRPDGVIDEDDQVGIVVIAHPGLLRRMQARRSSPFRTPSTLRIAGSEIRVSTFPGFVRDAEGSDPTPAPIACSVNTYWLDDFAPGRGEVELVARIDDGEEVTGTVDFNVNALYTGSFSFGWIASFHANPRFEVRDVGGNSIITYAENDIEPGSDPAADPKPGRQYLSAVFYTPFRSPRNLIDDPDFEIAPAFGISLQNVGDNYFAGLAVSWKSAFYVVGGFHATRVNELDTASGLAVGDAFTGSASELPITKDWRETGFLGATIDLRAAFQLFRSAFGEGS